jgi:site-specific recombinase XerD
MLQQLVPAYTPDVMLQQAEEDSQEFLRNSSAPNTIRAYRSQWKYFALWCNEVGLESLPATPDTVRLYISHRASDSKTGSIEVMISSIGKNHLANGFDDPCSTTVVRQTLKGIKRTLGCKVTQKNPILTKELRAMIDTIDNSTLTGKRNKALLLVSFFTAARRSELSDMKVEDLQFTEEGMIQTLPRSKTDQSQVGYKKFIVKKDSEYCPVSAIQDYLTTAGITEGYVWRAISQVGKLSTTHLTGQRICLIIKACCKAIGLDERNISGHSMRSGFATSAALAGVDLMGIMQVTAHKSSDTTMKYIRIANGFKTSATAKVDI